MFSFRSGGAESGFGPRHTRVVENGKSCTLLGAKILGEGLRLVAPVSVYYNVTGWYHVKCLGQDTLVKQYFEREH